MSEPGARLAPDAKTILVVDDEFDIVTVYTMLFSYYGYRVLSAANGRDALAAIALQPPDLIVSDYMMPQMDGVALCRALRQDEVLRHIPFILLSAAFPQDLSQLPCDAFLKKPVQFELLYAQVERLLAPAAR